MNVNIYLILLNYRYNINMLYNICIEYFDYIIYIYIYIYYNYNIEYTYEYII